MTPTISPYRIDVPDAAIERLKTKLSLATFPGETDFSNDWTRGAPQDDIKRLVTLWQEKYDWRHWEAELNNLPQFQTSISVDGHEDDLSVHFLHQKSDSPDSVPLLFCHGWPGSFIEVVKILPLLTTGGDGKKQTFHVVAPSLPNYGFSQRTSKPDFGIAQYGEVCHKLMLKLGYEKYVTQGGDLGTVITRVMGSLYPDHVLASHINFVLATPPSPLYTPHLVMQHLTGWYSPHEKAGLERTMWFRNEGSGYNQIQKTKPNTPGFAVADSPVGLLAWIYEKLRDWTDSYPWTDEEILTWVSIYQFSEAGPAASFQIYYEMTYPASEASKSTTAACMNWISIPLGLSYFPKDVVVLPSSWGRRLGPVVFEKRHVEGGHFAAHEKPEMLVDDLRQTVENAKVRQRLQK
ncbi:Alpha/Beta hydrolase protein [Xylariomycetidae sp. FL0641]|nr:Alpha/Beta hydrolase protein [Xylariomycetidae sp. FL0641]